MKIEESEACTDILNLPVPVFIGHLFHHIFSIDDDPRHVM